jgi:O-antigen/teichoic acid export membrane protein
MLFSGIKDLFRSQLRRNMLSGIIANVVNIGLVLVSYPIYLHYLGYEKFGIWIVLSTILTFMQMSNLGLGPAVTKLVAQEYGNMNNKGIVSYIHTGLLSVLATGTITLITLFVFKKPIIGFFKLGPENASLALDLLPYVGILTVYAFLIQILTAALTGLGRIDKVNYRDTACRAVSLGVAIILLISGQGIVSMLIASASSSIVMHISSIVLIRKVITFKFILPKWDARAFSRLFSFGIGVLGSSLLSMLFSPLNKLALSRYAGVAAVPLYEIAFNASFQIRNLLESAFRALVPEISRISVDISSEARERIARIYRRSMHFIFLYGAPVYLILMIVSPFLLELWLRERYLESLPAPFRIMLLGTFISLLSVPAYYMIMGLGKVRYCLISHIIQTATNAGYIGALILTGQALSAKSVSYASAFALGISTVYMLWQKKRVFGRYGFIKP